MNALTIGYAFIGGLLPSLIWLYFLLKEDARCPEPKGMILSAFAAGIIAVPIVLPLEEWARAGLVHTNSVLLAWAAIEEITKYVMAACFILWRRAVDEPTDYVIYMITVALGFAAAENALFLLSPLSAGNVASSFATDDLRFLGSTLLHVVASAIVGFSLAAAAMLRTHHRVLTVSFGLILAVALHTLFNTLIISAGDAPAMMAFFLVWSLAVVLFAALEVLKYFEYRNLPNETCPT